MPRTASFVQRKLGTALDAVRANLKRMSPATAILPLSNLEIFKHDRGAPADEIKFIVSPTIFLLPERATKPDPKLYVAVKGWISFETTGQGEEPLRTKTFGTEIGYFRVNTQAAEHVYGAHYDIHENAPGHPVFHAHIKQQMGLLSAVNVHFGKSWTAQNTPDKVVPVLSRVRTPTAQMDFFSVIVQLCADHLIHEGSGKEVLDAFSHISAASDFFIGAACRLSYLNANVAPGCYRSPHWYAR